MSFNIIGEYAFKIPIVTMFLNEMIVIKNTNLITFFGESFFLSRCVTDEFNPIQYICIGNGINAPQKMDIKLGNETKRNTCATEVNPDTNRLILTSSFSTKELVGASEIGVLTTKLDGTEILISHDVFNEVTLSENFLYGVIGQITVEYSFHFTTSQVKTGWKKYGNDKNVYWVYEPNDIVSIFDNTTNYGLKRVNTKEEVQLTKNSYFHDISKTHNIYIHLHHSDGTTASPIYAPNPNNHEIIVRNK